jgi:hypothetical protein
MILTHSLIYTIPASLYLVVLLMIDNRMFLSKGDYPDDVIAAVPPRTKAEMRKATILSAPWLLWSIGFPVWSTFQFIARAGGKPPFWVVSLYAFLIFFSFWLVDLVVLDILMFATITPKFVVIPGTEGFPGYKKIDWHLRGHFYKGLPLLIVLGLVVGLVVWFVG